MLVELLCRHDLVSLDVSGLRVMHHPDVNLVETILTRSSYHCLKCCHTGCYVCKCLVSRLLKLV